MTGQTVSHYTILEKIGDGGMGVVYKAHDARLDRHVAVKFLNHKLDSGSNEKERFMIEAMALAKLNHPNVATIYDVGEYDDKSFIVMEFIEGQNLRSIIESSNRNQGKEILTIERTIYFTRQILNGLNAAHRKNIIHRDIKPENLIIDSENRLKILDFGLAKIAWKGFLTRDGATIGTAAYMSPEQTSGGLIDQRTDIWAVGVVLYEMLTGCRPFNGDYEQAVIYSLLNEDPAPIKKNNSDIPDKLVDVVEKALAKNPDMRYQDCGQFLVDLGSLAESPVKDTSGTDIQESAIDRKKVVAKRNKMFWTATVTVLLLAAAFILIFFLTSPPEISPDKKIAVLPFINISNDPADEYLSDGIMEDILTQLVKISSLKVISRTTMMGYKNSRKSIREISSDLNADIVLEGSVRHVEDQLRITVQLIDARTDEHLWAETYNEQLSRGFNVESKIALQIANTLQIKLSNTEKDKFVASKIYDPEVYTMVLKGRYFVNKLDSSSIIKGIELFQKALSREPDDAMILTSLANAHTVYADCGFTTTEEGYSKARDLVEKALKIDDELAIAHTVLGLVKLVYDWDWIGAETEFQKAIKTGPSNTTTLNQMGQLARTLGRPDEAVLLLERAIDLEPVILINYVYLGQFLMYDHRFKEAVDVMHKGLEIDSRFAYLHYLIGCIYLLEGKNQLALEEMQKEPAENYRQYGLSMAYYALGRIKDSNLTLAECIKKYREIGTFNIAEIYAFRGETDKAFEWLEKAYSLKDSALPYITGDPFFNNISADGRFKTFMKKMKLPV